MNVVLIVMTVYAGVLTVTENIFPDYNECYAVKQELNAPEAFCMDKKLYDVKLK